MKTSQVESREAEKEKGEIAFGDNSSTRVQTQFWCLLFEGMVRRESLWRRKVNNESSFNLMSQTHSCAVMTQVIGFL